MPAAIEPGQKYSVSLMIDQAKDPKPIFYFPYLTGRQQRKLLEVYEQIGSGQIANADDLDRIFAELRKYLLGWDNLPISFDPAALEDLISITEAMELLNRLLLQMPSFEEKKS
jgi:hypothetical protein